MPHITPEAKIVNDLLRQARVLRRHYDLGCHYAFDGAELRAMFDRLVDLRAEFPENSSKHSRLTAELERYATRTGQTFWTGSRASAVAMAS